MNTLKLRMTLTGHSDLHLNDIGNVQLHNKHQVKLTSVDKSKIGRAIVLDQHLIDKLYLIKLLDASQHKACDKYLNIINRSGAFPAASSCWKEYLPVSGNSKPPIPRACILIKVQRSIKNKVGINKEKVFWNLMVNNPSKINDERLSLIIECADALVNHYWYDSDPVSYFQQALTDPN